MAQRVDSGEPGRALVIGAQGVLGSFIASALRGAGWSVIRAGRRPESAPDFRLVDVERPDTVTGACRDVDLVVSCVLPFCDCQCEGAGSGMRVCSDGAKFEDPTCAASNCVCAGTQGAPPSCTAYFGCSSGPVQINYTCNNPDDIAEDAPGTCSSSFCGCAGFDYVCDGSTSVNDESCITNAGCVCVGYTDGSTCSTGTGHFDCSGDGVADTDISNFYCESSCP